MSENLERLQQSAAEAQERAEKWEKLHTEATLKRELMRAAEEGGAHNPLQLMPYLMPAAKLVEINGQQVVQVVTTGEDGKEIHHTPAQAIAHLKHNQDLANLFKSAPAPQPAPAASQKIDWRNLTHEQYLKLRAKLGFGPKR
jgi:hypothetical protein